MTGGDEGKEKLFTAESLSPQRGIFFVCRETTADKKGLTAESWTGKICDQRLAISTCEGLNPTGGESFFNGGNLPPLKNESLSALSASLR
ncbi:MAG: hypothetical protein CVU57_23155 [Deltaproteobacteria bacterium HGW-Deltaproteobacteria-15]|nr:MAG: hypothetical protein CVU57_23155 [Deltaproteobacteria bacterium HGW-Deltaproteobacteria-15]